MMPTFPRSPPIIRTAGFPQYGWNAGFAGGAFVDDERLKPAPGMRRPTSSLHPPFARLVVSRLSRSVSGRRLDCAPDARKVGGLEKIPQPRDFNDMFRRQNRGN